VKPIYGLLAVTADFVMGLHKTT